MRIDVLDAPVSTSLAFYGPKAMRVKSLPFLDDSSDHLGAASVSCADVGSQVSAADMATSAADSSTSRDGQQEPTDGATSTSGRELATEEPFGIEIVRSRGGLRVIKEVSPCKYAALPFDRRAHIRRRALYVAHACLQHVMLV